uniref:C2 domain-containing protein n=1 Tax=Mesocestoides corti TaxID=53468 RepID=A0A5K3EK30_MESCO
MLDSGTTLLLSICVTLAAVAAIICAASLAVASPWWPHRRRHNKTPMGVVYRTIKALAIISPSGPTRHRDSTHRCSVFAESHSLPLRFQHEKLYGSTIPHRSSSRSSISSLYSPNAPSVHRGSIGEMGAASNKVTTVGGYLAPPAMRQRSGSTSLLHDIARRGFEGLTTVPPIPAFMSTVKPQPDSFLADAPTALHNLRSPPGNESHSSIESWTTLQTSEPKKAADVDPETQERRKSLHKARRKTLCSLPQKSVANELGTSLSELASILGTQVSKSSHTSPSRMRNVSSTIRAPSCILPTLSFSGDPAFSVAEAPGGTINYRVFIDATGKDNLAVRVHLYSASNLPSERPWKNSNYVVKAALIGFKSHFVQTSGPVTAACGSPRFSEGNPSVLDFVLDCGMPFNKSDEEIILNLMIIEFAGRKLGDKSVVVATTEYKFSHLTLNGKSTLSTDIRWERCRPSIDVYQLRADVLTSLTHKETEGCLRFEMKEIRNLGFRLVSEDLTLSTGTSRSSRRSSLYPNHSNYSR